MAQTIASLVVDASVVVKWKITTEDYAREAEDLLLDWRYHRVQLLAPHLLPAEVMSAFLRAHRRGRVSEDEAKEAMQDLLALPFVLFDVAPLAIRALALAQQHNQRSYDCFYVALAERESVELWTGDQRLYNAVRGPCACMRWIADYQRRRP